MNNLAVPFKIIALTETKINSDSIPFNFKMKTRKKSFMTISLASEIIIPQFTILSFYQR